MNRRAVALVLSGVDAVTEAATEQVAEQHDVVDPSHLGELGAPATRWQAPALP